MTVTHDINFWLAVFVVLGIIYVPVGVLAAFKGWVVKDVGRVHLVGDHWENAAGEDLSGREWGRGVHYHGGPPAKDLRP